MEAKNLTNISHFSDYEEQAKKRLKCILYFKDLKKLAKVKKRMRRTDENRDFLAREIIKEYGDDLFADRKRRELIGKRLGFLKSMIPKRWHRGSETIKEFVSNTDFPEQYSGEKYSNNKNVSYKLLGKNKTKELTFFQKEVIKESLEQLKTNKNSRFIISMPTGSGKTTTAIEIIKRYLKEFNNTKNIIWLAHNEELCRQAEDTFDNILSQLDEKRYLFPLWKEHFDRNKGDLIAKGEEENHPFIIIGTPLKILNYIRKDIKLKNFLHQKTSMIVIDEAHRAGARTYKEIITSFSEQNNEISFVGLTATPIRGSGRNGTDIDEIKELKSLFFDNLIFPKDTLGDTSKKMKLKLQDLGYLSKPIKICLKTDKPISIDQTKAIYYLNELNPLKVDRELQKASDTDKKREIILNYIVNSLDLNQNSKIIYFGASRLDAKKMSSLFRAQGYKSNYIDSETSSHKREAILKDFSCGKLQFLCNCEVLTTGFDDPKIDHVIMARPTISNILYEQMIGRGLRGEKFGGTKDCKILIWNDFEFPEGFEYYRFWEQDEDIIIDKWDYETFALKTLIFMIASDSTYHEEEVEKLKEIYLTLFNKNLTNDAIQEEINSIAGDLCSYNDNLHAISEKLTREQVLNLIESCVIIMVCDNDIAKEEIKFLETLILNLNSKNRLKKVS